MGHGETLVLRPGGADGARELAAGASAREGGVLAPDAHAALAALFPATAGIESPVERARRSPARAPNSGTTQQLWPISEAGEPPRSRRRRPQR